MKRFLFVLTVIGTMGIQMAHAQEMQKGMSLFNVGFGLFPGIGVNVSYDYGLIDEWGPGIFTVGGYVGYGTWGKVFNSFDYRVNTFAFSPRATYRYAINKSFEVYGVVMLGAAAYLYTKYKDSEFKVFYSTVAGCRYTFLRDIAVFAEAGYNEISFLNGGLSYSF